MSEQTGMQLTKLFNVRWETEDEHLGTLQYGRNRLNLGEIVRLEDGSYAYDPNRERAGVWNSYMMYAIANLLEDLNETH